ncbi:autotransporter-associated beta strand repeat-containing protein [Methylobacterium gossipiicola]|uniref:Autotransporter-associated beta strand repeat-containing protein n=2 Tax=Methylobacterium gossipiicola TaxID=582675 RepID=A0A1I2VC79_9HYPH|nr:autotransporter-associated beta strand repeat-containing protein [Methylobacterium gossipiicola]
MEPSGNNLDILTNSLTGGRGGDGGLVPTPGDGGNGGGGGGSGGGGLYIKGIVDTVGTIAGSAVVTGGAGGARGSSGALAGRGGSGIFAVNSGGVTTLTIESGATILGGAGGMSNGTGGIGIGGSNLTLVLGATANVSGGLSGDGAVRANAIQFTSGTNVLELQGNGTGYATLTGNVIGATGSGTSNTLKFSGRGGQFDASRIDLVGSNRTAPFKNFTAFEVRTDNATDTLVIDKYPVVTPNGKLGQYKDWVVSRGILQLGLSSSSASTSGGIQGSVVVKDGATLSTGGTGSAMASVAQNVTIEGGGHLKLSTVNGSVPISSGEGLSLASTSTVDVTLNAPSSTALAQVGLNRIAGSGNLTLGGTLNITNAGSMGEGDYILFNYFGTKSGALTIGTAPTDFEYGFSTTTTTTRGVTTSNLVLNVLGAGLYWNGATVTGSTGPVTGGDGTWTAGGATNWTNAGGTTNRAWTDGKAALFAGRPGTVTVDNSGVSAKSLEFVTSYYLIAGGSLTLADGANTPKINVDGASTFATVSAPVAGSHGLEKIGAGTLVLSGANTYTGDTAITAGTLALAPAADATYAGVISGAGAFEKAGAGTLILTGANTVTGGTTVTAGTLQVGDGGTIGSITGDIVNKATLTFKRSDAVTFAGAISGSGSLEQGGGGTLTLTGANTYTGATTVRSGTLTVESATGLGATAIGTTVAAGATLTFRNPNLATNTSGAVTPLTVAAEPLTLAGTGVAGTGALRFSSSALSGGIGFDGAITLAADTRIVSDPWPFGPSSVRLGGAITGVGTTLTVSADNPDTTLAGTLDLGAGGLIKEGTGSLTLTQANSYTGGTIVKAGSLTIDNGKALGTGPVTVQAGSTLWLGHDVTVDAVPLTLSGSVPEGGALTSYSGTNGYAGAITLAADTTIAKYKGSLTLSGGITGAGNTLTLYNGYGALTLSGAIATGSGGLIQTGRGTTILTGTNTYTGGTTISEGRLQIGDGGTTGSIQGPVVTNGTLVFERSDAVTFAGAISGSGGLEQQGTGTLTLTGANTYAGGTLVSAGTLVIGDGGTAGSITGDVFTQGALVFDRSDNVDFLGSIYGIGTLEKRGAGTLTLSSFSELGGGVTVSGGALQMYGGQLGGAITVKAGGAFAGDPAGGAGMVNDPLTVEAGGTLRMLAAGDTNLIVNQTVVMKPGAILQATLGAPSNTAAVTIDGGLTLDGTLNLTAGSGYRSGTYRLFDYAGTLAGGGLALGTTPTHALFGVDTARAGRVDLVVAAGQWWNGPRQSGGGTVAGGSGTWNVDRADTVWTDAAGADATAWTQTGLAIFAGRAGTVTVAGATAPTIAAMEFLTSGYTVTGGGLTLAGFRGNPVSRILVQDDAASGGGTATLASVLGGGQRLEKIGTGTLTLTGANTYTGGTTVTAGTLVVGDGGTAGSILGAVANAGTLVFDRADDITPGGAITGTGALIKRGAGTLTLGGVNGAGAGASVAAGTLALAGGARFEGDVAVQAGATLAGPTDGGATIAGAVTVADGATLRAAPVAGAGLYGLSVNRLDLAANATLAVSLGASTGNAAIQAGTLSLGGRLDVTAVDGLALGLYRLIDYTTLAADTGLRLGTTPTAYGYRIEHLPGQLALTVLDGSLLYWNGATTTPDGTVHGGSGTWDGGATTNWTTAQANQARAWDGRYAVFAGAPGTVTVAAAEKPVAVTGVQFMVDGYTVTGAGLTLASPGGRTQIRVGDGTAAGAGSVARVFAPLGGTTGLEKTDLGTLILGGANTYTGGTLVSSGTLQVGDGATSGSIQGDVINNATLVFDRADATGLAGAISGSGRVIKRGGGTLSLTGVNPYTGGTTIAAGAIRVLAAEALGGGALALQGQGTLRAGAGFADGRAVSLTAVDGVGGGVVAVEAGQVLTLSGVLSGAGALTVSGPGTLRLTGANTYAGATTIASGRLEIAGGASLSDSAALTVAAGAGLSLTDAGETVGSLFGGGGIALNGHCLTASGGAFSGSLSGGGCLAKTGAGTLTLSGQSEGYTGTTTVSQGLLQVTTDARALGTGALALSGAGTLRASATYTDGRAISLTSAGGAGGGTVLVDDGRTLTLTGTLTGLGNLAKTGTGTLVLGGGGTHGGATQVAEGTLIATGGRAIGDTSAVSVSDGARFVLRGDEAIGSLAGAGQVVLDGARLGVGGDNTGTGFSGLLSGSGGLTKSGSGTLILSGANTYTGDTRVAGGTLAVTGGLAGDVSVQDGATLSGGGRVARTVHVLDGGTLAGQPGAGLGLGALDMAGKATLAVTLGAPSTTEVFRVAGDVRLGGTLAVTPTTGFGLGVYRILSYGGRLTDTGMGVGALPDGLLGGVQTSVAHQVNLFVEDANSPMAFWNGAGTRLSQGVVGGTGTWSADARTNWTNANGTIDRRWPAGFAVFQGTAGTVTVDTAGPVRTAGMQFVESGYTVAGGPLTLTGATATIRVGDGTVAGAKTQATIAATLAGSARLDKSDFGTLILAGANTYTGGTAITAGTLRLGAGGTAGSIQGDVANAGTLVFDRSDTARFTGAISGTGRVVQAGSGTTVLTGLNTYTGGTAITAGTLQVGGDAALGAASGAVALDGGTLAASASFASGRTVTLGGGGGTVAVTAATDTLTLGGDLTGSGGLTKTGAGTLLLLGTGRYAGRTTIDDGTLQIGNGGTAGSISGEVLNNARLVFNRSDTYGFQGNIKGSGKVEFVGGGRVLFTATDAYTGPVGVKDTMVRLDPGSATTSPFVIEAGGVLGGTATIGGLTINSGGTASPGYSPGTLTVTGPVAFNAGALYAVDVTPDGRHDLITATGPVTLSSQAAVRVQATPGRYAPTARYTILSTTATLTGRFGTVTSDYAFLDPVLSYDAQNVYLGLTYTGQAFTAFARSPNQIAVAAAAQALGAGNRIHDTLMTLPEGAVAFAFDQLGGEVHPSLNTVLQQQSVYLRDGVGARLRQSGGGTLLTRAARGSGPVTQDLALDFAPTLWAQAFGGLGERLGGSNAASIANRIGGVLGGIDVQVGEGIRAGVVGSVSQSIFDLNARASNGSFTNYGIGAYAGGQWDGFGLKGGVSRGWHDVSALRAVAIPGFSASNASRETVATTQVFGEASYDIALGGYALQPFAGLAYVDVAAHRVREGGLGGAGLTGTVQGQGVGYTTLGVRAATTFSVAGHTLMPSLTLGWQHALGDVVPNASLFLPGGTTPLGIAGVPVARDMALVGAGLAYEISELSRIQVNYSGQVGPRASQNTFSAQYSLRF